MNVRDMMLSATVVALAVVAGLLGAGGTWALWNASAFAGAGAVRSADFRVEINGSPMTTGGVAATINVQGSGPLTPTSPAYAMLTLSNRTDAGSPFTVRAGLGTPRVSNATVAQLATSLSVQTAVAPASGQCSAATYGATPASADISKGGAAQFCVRMSLPADAAESLSNASATVAIPVTATQLS